ncbi:hypothetical protein AMIS_57310 [Actinoplanes missouriensis 431]|uniref:Integral membrane protein n=1 Tax=Actinoplanes missouriensis (strain ATCC 14538 / DSM 43046 / CBS 188.64 / JCM 3121 / NBRC 102363 / NCIMB 12654 / NRRL B-3342 / UNCC 431) TaxID=512565 RepID=I0HD64_ACTM4|nr:hypothetical protein [Actinoplanes missouriensis]BAL90951.1 hypothetical protein AMIS_57310 [Actinoplanes missouriensis 431]
MDYPIALALEDFVPVIFGTAGFALLSQTAPTPAARRAGFTGAMLIGAGGIAKCVWKLGYAAGAGDWKLFEQALFPLMAAGATLLAWALAVTVRRGRRTRAWPFALVLGLCAAGSILAESLNPLFVAATLGVTAISVLGAIIAARYQQWWAVSLYVLGLVLVMGLVPLRGSDSHHTVAFQWLEQGINTSAQAALLVAAWLTLRAVRRPVLVGATQ